MEGQETAKQRTLNRRDFLRLGAGATAALAIATLPQIEVAAAATDAKQATLAQCIAMSPQQMAERSEMVKNAYRYVVATAGEIQDGALRRAVQEAVANPAPRVMTQFSGGRDVESVLQKLADQGLVTEQALHGTVALIPPLDDPATAPQSWLSAPGSGYGSHHSYPGGLSTHIAANVKTAVALQRTYREVYGYELNRDVIIAAQTLHDLHKPWVFQWQADGASLPEATIAGQGAHHVLSLAESMHRELPAEMIVAQACAHNHPGSAKDEADVVAWLKAAAIVAGKDPCRIGVLAKSGDTLPKPHQQEGYLTHLGDHDWVLSVPAAQQSIAALRNVAERDYGLRGAELNGRPFYQFRNYVASQVGMMTLQHEMAVNGEDGVRKLVQRILIG